MGVLAWVIGIGVAGKIIGSMNKNARIEAQRAKEKREEEERRKNTQCLFLDGISQKEFEVIVAHIARKIRRITDISTEGPVVYGTVQSQSGISEWDFKIDFNDYGHLTGDYWVSSDNDDSSIPWNLAKMIKEAIQNYPDSLSVITKEATIRKSPQQFWFCPYCGNKKMVSTAKYCTNCGKKLV